MVLSPSKLLFVALFSATVFTNVHAETATFTFAIKFDLWPSENSFSVTSLADGEVVASSPTFEFEVWSGKLYTQTMELVLGGQYLLTVKDSAQNGLTEPTGEYGIFYGAQLTDASQTIVHEMHFDDDQDEIIFTAKKPVVTPAPTTLDSSKVPSSAPTTCREDAVDWLDTDLWPLIDEVGLRSKPHFKSADTVWPDTNQFCVSHTSYKGCVNEAREDCQWTFRSASHAAGTCRVDPVAACIRNGNCVCNTEDFQGGGADLGDGILFHAPLSVTAGDISEYKELVSYSEFWARPDVEDPRHPQRDDFFISRVDFTGRKYLYEFDSESPIMRDGDTTVLFKLHFLYMDVPMEGRIYTASGLVVDISTTSASTITINGHQYSLPSEMKKWTCTAVAITSAHLYVGTTKIPRDLAQEDIPSSSPESRQVGPFSGELFDVRIYAGTLTAIEISEVGQRCAAPNDLHAMRYRESLSFIYEINGCNQGEFIVLHAGAGGRDPTDSKQTYASGPFATLWNTPRLTLFGTYEDVGVGSFDEEKMFQHAKIQSYLWEKWFFDNDMIAFNQEPYRSFNSEDEVGAAFKKFWNNPCLYMHNQNNGWQYPIYGQGDNINIGIEKWTNEEHGDGDPNAVFDIFRLYETGGDLEFLAYFAHEGFHAFQGNMWDMYASIQSQWFFESTAEYGSQ